MAIATENTPVTGAGAAPGATLLEPSFLDLMTAIEQATDLSTERKRHWISSLRQIAKGLDRPAASVPARWNAITLSIAHLHHSRIGLTAKTLANHKSNVRAALRWFSDEHNVPQQGARLTAEWANLGGQIDKPTRLRLFNFVRYCSAREIAPSCVDDNILRAYWSYRSEFTRMVSHDSARRMMVRAWNSCAAALAGWSLRTLTEPPLKVTKPAWHEFPQGLRDDIDNYFARFAKPRRSLNGKRLKACRPTTIANRRAEVVAVARMAVRRLGVPIESLTSLSALLDPDVVEKVIDAYWRKNGEDPKIGTIDLGWKLARMARDTNCLDQAAFDRLDEISAALEEHRREGMTQKNLRLIRQVLSGDVWSEVVSLPNVLMQEARTAKYHAPLKVRCQPSSRLVSQSRLSRPCASAISSASNWTGILSNQADWILRTGLCFRIMM
jgi:hypothetical protein